MSRTDPGIPFSLRACDYAITGVAVYDVSDFLKKRFVNHRIIQNQSSQKRSVLKYKRFGPLDISEYCYGCAVKVDVPSLGDMYHLEIILSGSCTWSNQGESICLQRGDSLFLTPFEEYCMDYSADCTKLVIRIRQDFLLQVAREFGYLTSSNSMSFRHRVLRFEDSVALHNLLLDILDQEYNSRSERVNLYYSKLLSNAILSTYSSDAVQPHDTPAPGHRYIRRIRDYVLDNITGDIQVDELARLCRISRKSLYNLFERETAITPSAYIRQLKLEAVHAELSTNMRIRTITEVALKYGFTNLGRFSAQYRNYVGELPSETLKRLGC